MRRFTSIFKNNNQELAELNAQRRNWLYASSIAFVGIIITIFAWESTSELRTNGAWWVVSSIMLIVSINWWYWTMRVINKLLTQQKLEYIILQEVLTDLREIRSDVKLYNIKGSSTSDNENKTDS